MTTTFERDYETLELKPDASWAEVRRSYRHLVQTWHPDRFSERPLEKQLAQDRFVRVTTAYHNLRRFNRDNNHLPLQDPNLANSDVQNSTPQDATAQDTAPHDHTTPDFTPYDHTEPDFTPYDHTKPDFTPHNHAQQDYGRKDHAQQEYIPPNPTQQDNTQQNHNPESYTQRPRAPSSPRKRKKSKAAKHDNDLFEIDADREKSTKPKYWLWAIPLLAVIAILVLFVFLDKRSSQQHSDSAIKASEATQIVEVTE